MKVALEQVFSPVRLDGLLALAEQKKNDGYRFVQMLCVNTDNGIDLIYTFAKGSLMENYTIEGVSSDSEVPSVSDFYLSAFPFENEAHDLFGVNITGMVIDFNGNFYKVAMDKPMTVISPEQKAAKEKAARIAAAKAAKAAKAARDAQAAAAGETASERASAADSARTGMSADELEAKLATMDPEKAAKVRAAMAAKAARAAKAEKGGE